MNDDTRDTHNVEEPEPSRRKTEPNPSGEPTYACHQAAHLIAACPGCRMAFEPIVNQRIVEILYALGQPPTTSH